MAGGVTAPAGAGIGRVLPLIMALALTLAACGGEDEPELTFEDRLVELEGQPLTPLDVARRAEVGRTLCLLDDRILDEMWQQLSEEQLDFQDIVIVSFCPERAVLYAGHTGRFVTEEAEQSGVRTSTTRPTSTALLTTGPTTTRPGTTSTGGAATSVDSATTGSTTASSRSTTSRPSASPTTTTLGSASS